MHGGRAGGAGSFAVGGFLPIAATVLLLVEKTRLHAMVAHIDDAALLHEWAA